MESRNLRPLGVAPSGERKLATVLFADLVGSTELADEQDPERTRVLLDRFYDAMAAEIEAAGGAVEKFIGDAVMAAFGVPATQEDHAERALHAALAMQRRLAEIFGETLSLRIGVNTGEVVLGRGREGSSFVTGDTVNVAARLEAAAEPGEILVGERTANAVRGAFEFTASRSIDAKGKPQGVRCRRLVRALSLMRPRGIGDLRLAFVGRDAELELLQATYDRVLEEGSPELVTILGEAGVGKTRLVREFWQAIGAQSPVPLRRTGRCLRYGQSITYWPLGEILKEHFGLLESDSPQDSLVRLGTWEILGLTLGLDVAGDIHPLVARDRLHGAWVRFLEDLVDDQPAVILVEDLHWAKAELLDLLEFLLQQVQGPMLLLCTARPELLDVRPGWGGARRTGSTVELEPLSREHSDHLVEALLAAGLAAELRTLVVARAEGNPFFVEELLGTLIDEGVLVRDNGGWTVRELPTGFTMPDSVQAVLSARIDLLATDEKAALQAASVIGRVFWTGPIYELLPAMTPDFRVLEDRDFIRRRSGSSIAGETEFVFKHQLTREVAYGSLPKVKRSRLHADFAAWLERFGGGRDEHAPRLAYHYAEAVRPEEADLAWMGAEDELERLRVKAVAWLRRAAQLSASRYEIRDALSLLDQALVLEADDQAKVGILRNVGDVHMLNYDAEGFRLAMERALAIGPDDAVAADIYARLAWYGCGRPYLWRDPLPAELGEQWLKRALELAQPESAARAEALLADALATPEAGAVAAAEGFALAESLGIPRLIVNACEAQALVASTAGRFTDACGWADRALEKVPMVNDPGVRMHQHWLAGFVYLRGGRVTDVTHLTEECDRLAALLTPHDEVHAVALRALHQSSLGRWQALAELSERAALAAEANEATPCQFNWRSLLVCALGLARLGHEQEARRLEELALAGPVVAGPPEREPALLRLALLRGDLDEVARILESLPVSVDPWGLDAAAARLDALVALGEAARVEEEAAPFLDSESYTRPFALRALGLVQGDRALVRDAVASFEAMGLEWQAAETHSLQKVIRGSR
ncbi:MAG TPA: adenylate/guanylate cyclase domain-containing protein [Gaiellaceae bacterium]|jgi:class 3 adenylate cyclase